MPSGVATSGSGASPNSLRLLDPRLDLANAGQVLVELGLVVRVEPPLQRLGVVEDEVEDRLLLVPAGASGSPAAGRDRPAPKSRSKTSRGLDSGGIGVVGELQERLYW